MKYLEEMVKKQRLIIPETITHEKVQEIKGAIFTMTLQGVRKADLIIDSKGGSPEAALQLCDVIIASGIRFRGVASGSCMSAAALVLQACSWRVSLPNSKFCIHAIYRQFQKTITADTKIEDFAKEISEHVSELKDLEAKVFKIERNRITDMVLFEKHRVADDSFDADEALKMGLIDKIVTDLTYG